MALCDAALARFAGSAHGSTRRRSRRELKWSFSGPFGKYRPRASCSAASRSIAKSARSVTVSTLLSFRNLGEPRRSRVHAGAGRGHRGGIQGQGRPERQGRICSSGRPPGRPLSRCRSRTIRRHARPTAARCRRTCRCSPRRAATSAASRRSSSTSSPSIQEMGPDYIAAVLTGYENPPAGFKLPSPTTYYNKYFPGHAIGMPKPLSRRPGRIHRRHAGDGRAIRQGRHGIPDVGGGAAPRSAQEARLHGDDLPRRAPGLLYFTKKKVWKDIHAH